MGETRITNAQDCGSKLEELKQRAKAVLPAGTIRVYDLMPVFEDAVLFAEITRALAEPFAGRVDVVVAPEALGWVLGAALARELGAGFVGVRKKGKLPYPPDRLVSQHFADYDGPKTLQLRSDAPLPGKRVLLTDEWIETGSQAQALLRLLGHWDCQVVGIAALGIDRNSVTTPWLDTDFAHCLGTDW